MDYLILFYILIIIGIGAVIFLLLRKKQEIPQKDEGQLLMLQQQINHISQTLDTKLSESTKNQQFQFNEANKIIGDVRERLAKLDETNKQVVGFTDQLKSLQDILKNPKQRGILGEYYLETLLKNVLPPGSYQMQYNLGLDEKTGKDLIVDAVVFVKDKIIPIDSKFSLENYNRMVEEKNPAEKERLEKAFKADLKLRIDETAKYVKPEKGTMDFALMFIPHEAIYYDLLIGQVGGAKINARDLLEYAFRDKHVAIVSPTNFLALISTILQGLNALKVEESTKEIARNIEKLRGHLLVYEDYVKKVGNHLSATVNAYNNAGNEFKKIDKDIVKITGGEIKANIDGIERPMLDE
ncbi:MAG: DNA recombination protein RmuC [Patescibacteria group bacterium]